MLWLRRWLPDISAAGAVLLLADLAINAGFFMLIPYLSVHVTGTLGLSAAAAGSVLAMRMLAQQLLMVFAGPVGDLYGYKRVLVLGLLIRAVGFGSFALMGNLSGLLISAVLSGLGGALFASAEKASFAAVTAGPGQNQRFALLNVAQSAGVTVGPLLGALLLGVDFGVLSVAAGSVYIAVAALVLIYLPRVESARVRRPAGGARAVFRSVMSVARHGSFVAYTLITGGYWLVSGQLNISLSLHARSITGSITAVKYLLLLHALLVVLAQYRVAGWAGAHWTPMRQLALGTGLVGVGFALLVPFPGMAGLVACTVLMSMGAMLVRPTDQTIIMSFARPEALASYYGFSALSVALGGSTGQYLGGRLMDLATQTALAWLPWAVLASLAGLAAAGISWMAARHLVPAEVDHLPGEADSRAT